MRLEAIMGDDFPPVSTAEWEAAIAADLKGADYDKKLIWRSEEGIAVRPYYRREDIAGLQAQTEGPPGDRAGWEIEQEPFVSAGSIRADDLHEGGANAVQELGYVLAAGVERLAESAEKKPVDEAAREIEFVFAIGSTYFMEIAKLRAARLLWTQAVAAFGPHDPDSCRMRLHARTSRRNKSIYDRYTNLLRATTEALSAAIGGAGSIYVEPFGFDAHLAVGVQRILKHEAHMDAVADTGAGSYFIEVLTDSLAREGWKLFQQVEAAGGYSKAVASGSVGRALEESRVALEKAVAHRRRTLVGVNNYPDLTQKRSDVTPPDGSHLRLAEPFERIRQRTAEYAQTAGRFPKVLLVTRGDLKMRTSRANFSRNLFGCAGFDIEEAEDYAGSDVDLIVLCSSDPEYLALAREVCATVSVPVIVAGNPKDQIDALKQAGVAGFAHAGIDAVEALTEWQKRLGMDASR
jgi:methylmalonyl-CoA mutase